MYRFGFFHWRLCAGSSGRCLPEIQQSDRRCNKWLQAGEWRLGSQPSHQTSEPELCRKTNKHVPQTWLSFQYSNKITRHATILAMCSMYPYHVARQWQLSLAVPKLTLPYQWFNKVLENSLQLKGS